MSDNSEVVFKRRNTNDESDPNEGIGISSGVVNRIRATDTVVSALQRWITVILIFAGFCVTIGVNITKFGNMEASISELREDLKTTTGKANELAMQVAISARDDAERDRKITELYELNARLTGQLDTIRNMREAYVYDSAKEAKKAILSRSLTPP